MCCFLCSKGSMMDKEAKPFLTLPQSTPLISTLFLLSLLHSSIRDGLEKKCWTSEARHRRFRFPLLYPPLGSLTKCYFINKWAATKTNTCGFPFMSDLALLKERRKKTPSISIFFSLSPLLMVKLYFSAQWFSYATCGTTRHMLLPNKLCNTTWDNRVLVT